MAEKRQNSTRSLLGLVMPCLISSFLSLPVRTEQIKLETDNPAEVAEETKKTADEAGLIGRNPFLFPEEDLLKETRMIITSAALSAIFVSASRQSYAIIDGKIVKRGDTFQGKEIIKITASEVELGDINGRYVIYMDKK